MHKGFTLIELLLTISIIGILTTVLLVNVLGFRERSRDVTRKKDLRTIQTALELYRSDASDYPASLPACNASLSYGTVIYIRKMPCDPKTGTGYGDGSKYAKTGATYTLTVCLENEKDSEKDATTLGGCSPASFTVYSP
jgi:prepilin-type N-terminal cleavage/methylation domain-containing protein